LYDMGLGTERDFGQAAHWFALAAAQGNADGEFDLGMSYLHGEGVEQDYTLARECSSSALHHGDGGRSASGIAMTYEHGAHADYARKLLAGTGRQHKRDSEGQYGVCRISAQGLGGPADYPEAVKWCTNLAETGDEWGEYGMGRIYEDEIVAPIDLVKAAEWYKKSAEQWNPPSQLRLGLLYSEGKGVKRDLNQSLYVDIRGWLREASRCDRLS
jgi:uncharacterized protein